MDVAVGVLGVRVQHAAEVMEPIGRRAGVFVAGPGDRRWLAGVGGRRTAAAAGGERRRQANTRLPATPVHGN